jgi:hypothetical protein
MKKTFLSFLITLLILSFSCFAFAQPMEEDEEPVQTRPSPMEKSSMKGHKMNSVKSRQNVSGENATLKPSGTNLGSTVEKELGDDIVDPEKKTGNSMMKGKSIK